MHPIHILTLFLVIATPVAWATSEFQERRWLRIILGSAVIAVCFGVAYLAGSFQMLNANAWYGFASKELVDTTIAELEAGNQRRVVDCLKELQKQYTPTYENRARYDKLVEETVRRMKTVDPPALKQDGPPKSI